MLFAFSFDHKSTSTGFFHYDVESLKDWLRIFKIKLGLGEKVRYFHQIFVLLTHTHIHRLDKSYFGLGSFKRV